MVITTKVYIACVASVSVGFQSTERPKNEILIILPRKIWEQVRNGARGEGGRNYGTKNGVGGRGGGGERKRLPAKVVILKNPVRQPTEKSVLLIGAAYSMMIDV